MRLPSRRQLAMGAAGIAVTGTAASLALGYGAKKFLDRMRMADLRGQVALITGGSRGFGFAIARELATQGCKLVLCARHADALEWARDELTRSGAEVMTVVCDVGKQEEVDVMVRQVIERHGVIDILVNNAGIISVGPIESQTLGDFEEAMQVMFWAQVYTTLAVLPHMMHRRYGRIANVTSVGGKISVPHLVPYSCAKFAAVGFSEGIAAELAKDNIRVTTVVPGLLRTGSHVNAEFKGDYRTEYSWFSLAATSPISAISARRAARSTVNAIRRGQAEIILGLPAKLAVWFHGLLPGTAITLAGIGNRLMPGTGNPNTERHSGKQSETAISQSFLTSLGRTAGRHLHQYPEERRAL
jgi:short-subunit dehydrogenase